MVLRAITLHRPWGHGIAHLGKPVENRTWKCPLPIGSYLAIHNGKKWDTTAVEFIEQVVGVKVDVTRESDPEMAIIAVARFAGNYTDFDSDWFMGPIGWAFRDVTPIAPVPCPGQQGIWTVKGDVLAEVKARYKEAKPCPT